MTAQSSPLAKNKIVLAQSRAEHHGGVRAPGHSTLRNGFHHLRAYSKAQGFGEFDVDQAVHGRVDRVEAPAGAVEADHRRELRPVDRVEVAVFGADRHDVATLPRPG